MRDIKKLVACVLTAWDLLSLDKGPKNAAAQKIQSVLHYLDQRIARLSVPVRCNEWENFKRQATKCQASPMEIVRMRRKETASSKISQVDSR